VPSCRESISIQAVYWTFTLAALVDFQQTKRVCFVQGLGLSGDLGGFGKTGEFSLGGLI